MTVVLHEFPEKFKLFELLLKICKKNDIFYLLLPCFQCFPLRKLGNHWQVQKYPPLPPSKEKETVNVQSTPSEAIFTKHTANFLYRK